MIPAHPAVLRSKGFMWMSNSHATAYYWSHAGQHFEIRDEGDWCVATDGRGTAQGGWSAAEAVVNAPHRFDWGSGWVMEASPAVRKGQTCRPPWYACTGHWAQVCCA